MVTHSLILASSPADAHRHGSVGLQATALHRGRCASSFSRKWPLGICQMKTQPSSTTDVSWAWAILEVIGKSQFTDLQNR